MSEEWRDRDRETRRLVCWLHAHTHTHSYFTHSQYHIMFYQDISGSLDVRGGERQRQGGWFSGWQAEAGALKIIKAFQVEREAQGVKE